MIGFFGLMEMLAFAVPALASIALTAYGAWRARTVEMTKMPELVAFMHSMIGLAAVFIAQATDTPMTLNEGAETMGTG